MDISVVIVNYNVKEYIISCIQSIYKHSKSNLSFEIIVIDNNSQDGSCEKLKKEFPQISLIRNNTNAGFSVGVNQGVKVSKGKYIFILNPDTLFVEDCLSKLIKVADNYEKLGAIGPSLITETGSIQQSFWKKPSIINTILSISHLDFLNFHKNYGFKKFNSTKRVDSISGGAFLVLKKVYNKLKGFNENLFWMEDIDFCIRAKKMGFEILYSPLTKIIHLSGKSAEKNIRVVILNQLISKIKFFKYHHPKIEYFIILISILMISLIKSLIILLISPFSKLYRKKLIAYLYTVRSILFNNW